VLFENGVAFDRITGFTELGSKDDFTTLQLHKLIEKKWQNFREKRENAKKAAKKQSEKGLNLAHHRPVWIN